MAKKGPDAEKIGEIIWKIALNLLRDSRKNRNSQPTVGELLRYKNKDIKVFEDKVFMDF